MKKTLKEIKKLRAHVLNKYTIGGDNKRDIKFCAHKVILHLEALDEVLQIEHKKYMTSLLVEQGRKQIYKELQMI